MRIGLLLFGHLRSYKDTYSSFGKLKKTLMQEGEVDVFCHTWDIKESLSPAWWKTNENNNILPPLVDEAELVSMYAPGQYQIETSRQFEEPELGINSSIPIAGMCSMLYSQLQAFKLLKKHEQQHGFQYDIIIKTRYDLLYEIAPPFAKLLQIALDNKCIFLPSSNPYELAGAYSDIFALGGRAEMEKYFLFNDHLIEAASIYGEKAYREMVPELFMSVYLKNENVPMRETVGFRIHILRMNGEKFSINSDRYFEGNSPLCFYKPSIEKCIGFLPSGSKEIANNSEQLAKKYLSWIVREENEINEYASFYNGNWIPFDKIKNLINISKQQKLFADHVLRDFFEMSFWNANYNFVKKILLATFLAARGGYGLLYFSVIKKKLFNV
jgi:hypothetical protein